jgi:hypothetical protein
MKSDYNVRAELLGTTIADLIGNSDLLIGLIALYIGFKILMLLIAASDWQQYLMFAQRRHTREMKKYSQNIP